MSETNRHEIRNRLSESNVVIVNSTDHDASLQGDATRSDMPRGERSWLNRRVLAALIAAMVLVAGLGYALTPRAESKTDNSSQPRILAVRTASLVPVSSYHTVHQYTGKIVAHRTSKLGFELAGKLKYVYADEGDSVVEGSILAQLDTEHLEVKRRQIVAKQTQARERLGEMVAGPRVENIAAAEARVESLQAVVALLISQQKRREILIEEDVISHDEYEEYTFNLKARRANLAEAGHHLDELRNGTRKEQVASQRAVVAELDAAVTEIDVDLRKSTLKAPFAGTIARRLADEGTVVNSGQPIFRLVEDQKLEAWVGLPAHAAESLTTNLQLRVKIGQRQLTATVVARFPEVDPATRTRTVVFKLNDSAARRIVHGQVVRLQLEETVEANGFWLPTTALAKGSRGLWTTFVVAKTVSNDSTTPDLYEVQRRDIEILHTESDRVLVRGTLSPGDRVITGGTHRVVPGQVVRLIK